MVYEYIQELEEDRQTKKRSTVQVHTPKKEGRRNCEGGDKSLFRKLLFIVVRFRFPLSPLFRALPLSTLHSPSSYDSTEPKEKRKEKLQNYKMLEIHRQPLWHPRSITTTMTGYGFWLSGIVGKGEKIYQSITSFFLILNPSMILIADC